MPRKTRPGLEVVTRPGTAAFYLRGTVRGISVYESTGTADPILAEEARSTREAELYRLALHGAKAKVTFAAATLSYLEVKQPGEGTKAKLTRLLMHFGPRTFCHEIDQERIDRAAKALLRPNTASSTRLREIVTPVRSVLHHAARRNWVATPKFEPISAGPSRTEWLTPTEAGALIAAAVEHAKPLLTFLFCTGARTGEAFDLQWADVDLQNARAVLRDTKNSLDRIVDLPPRAVATLASLPHRDGKVFRHRHGKEYADHHRLYGGQIKTAWAGALKRSGIAKVVTPHHTRHTWASWHYATHKDLLRLKQDGCWASVVQVERYAHLVPDGLRPAILAFLGTPTKLAQSIAAAT